MGHFKVSSHNQAITSALRPATVDRSALAMFEVDIVPFPIVTISA